MSVKELKDRIGIDLQTLYDGSFGIWIQIGSSQMKAYNVHIDLVSGCWITDKGIYYFADRGRTWAIRRKEFSYHGKKDY